MRCSARRSGWLSISLAGGVVALVLGCSSMRPATIGQLQQRAEFDTGCPANYLRLYQLDDDTIGVVGCGWRLVYVQSCVPRPQRDSCRWLVDTPSGPAALGRPAAPWGAPAAAVPAATGGPVAASPAAKPAPAATSSAPPSAVQTGYGKLHVASDGGYCAVMVNGISHGFTPVAGLPVLAGPALVTCHAQDGTVIQRTVQIQVDQTARIRFQLPRRQLVDVTTQDPFKDR